MFSLFIHLVRTILGDNAVEDFWAWLWWVVSHWITRYVVSWLVCLGALALSLHYAWVAFGAGPQGENRGKAGRVDGNEGHVTIDFGGQWLMGAMLVQGHGKHLFNRNVQREVLIAALPYEDETPDEERKPEDRGTRDHQKLMSWVMGTGNDNRAAAETVGSCVSPLTAGHGLDAIATIAVCSELEWTKPKLDNAIERRLGGPLYPPINAFYMGPLAVMSPKPAYRVNQVLCLVWALGTGLAVSYMSRGRFWWPLATVLVLLYPGFKGAHHLGQNPPLTLFLLVWGWALLVRGHPIVGGVVWGLLAFKPVWAAAFFWIPFVTGRFRFCFSMLATGAGLAALTLPFVGFDSWLHWLQIGPEATRTYNVDQNWVFLSRDLLSIPRRFLLDFSQSYYQRDRIDATIVGWGLWVAVLEITLMMVVMRPKQARETTGPIAAFLLLAGWMNCFHFMYYDILLSALPVFVLLTEPRRYLDPIMVAVVPLSSRQVGEDLAAYYGPNVPTEYPSEVPLLQAKHRNILVLNRVVPNVVLLLIIIEHFFNAIGLAASITGPWTNDPAFDVTVSWQAVGGNTVSTPSKWAPAPLRISTHLFVDPPGQPWDTYLCMFLWAWAGWQWHRMGRPRAAPAPLAEEAEDVILMPVEAPPGHAIRPA
ncbi:MAG: DUF2029 domain-containing protein [Gemmataceae bacterium]|nr:DUF2029 domain-containing protein [Gemmataceae bacterium]